MKKTNPSRADVAEHALAGLIAHRASLDGLPARGRGVPRLTVAQLHSGFAADLKVDVELTIELQRGVDLTIVDGGNWPLESLSVEDMAAMVDQLGAAAAAAWSDRTPILKMLRNVKAAAHRLSARSPFPLPLRAARLARHRVSLDDGMAVTVEFEGLDDALQPTTLSYEVATSFGLSECVAYDLDLQARRHRRAEEAKAVGADIVMDGVTLAALRHYGLDVAAILTTFRGNTFSEVPLSEGGAGGEDKIMLLQWKDGILSSYFDLEEDLRWQDDSLVVSNDRISVPLAEGKSLHEIVDNPILDGVKVVRALGTGPSVMVRTDRQQFWVERRSGTVVDRLAA